MLTVLFIVWILGFVAAYSFLNFANREYRTWGFVVLSFIYSLGSWVSITYSVLEYWWTEVPQRRKRWWLRSVPKWFPVLLTFLFISCSQTRPIATTIKVRKHGPLYEVTTIRRTTNGPLVTKEYYDCLPDSLSAYKK